MGPVCLLIHAYRYVYHYSLTSVKTMTSNQKRCGVVRSESAERRESGTDERIRKSGIDGVKIGYIWDDK